MRDRAGHRLRVGVFGVAVEDEADALFFRERLPRRDAFVGRGRDVDHLALGPGAFCTCELEQPVDEACEPGDLVGGGLEVGAVRGRSLLQILEPEAQGSERSAQLVRGIGDEGPLRADELLEARGHGVELLGERTNLGRSGVGRRAGAASRPA